MPVDSARKKILLVDDNEIQLEILESMLEGEFLLSKAKSGKEAMAFLMTGLAPHLILLDIVMPEMDGWETFNRLKAISCLHDVPIAFITSLDEKEDLDRAYSMGAADFITKPVERNELLTRINSILKKHKAAANGS
jgi:CheY-like chemotaxis protein